ncbi:MAG: outer membrane scaffolding protein for murein synthesis (MipA/OmpV family) [Oleispira sp.]|jgi:outer membrane scaffolding protein for murein synthesis (MipA/OmpV family)
MTTYLKILATIGSTLFSTISTAEASNLAESITEPAFGLWSVAATAQSSQFKAVDNQYAPSLLVFGGYGPIFIEANRFGYNFYRDGTFFSSIIGNFRGHSSLSQADINSSDALQAYNLDERKNALEIGIQLGRRFNNGWIGRLALLQDISATHKAQEAELSFYRRDHVTPILSLNSIRLLTTLAIQGQSEQLNNYYYGVDTHELGSSGENSYKAGAGWSTELELIATYDFSWNSSGEKNWGMYAGLRHYYYSDTVTASPIVESGLVQQYFMGLGTYF